MCCGQTSKRGTGTKGRARLRRPVNARDIAIQSLGVKTVDFLMCRPDHYGIQYQINPWMDVNNGANKNKAIEQWNSLEAKIRELGGRTLMVKSIEGLPDMVFTANAGLVLKNGDVIVSHFTHPERANEEEYFSKWFLEIGRKVTHTTTSFEGAGDALYLGDTLVCGYGFRSDKQFYDGFNTHICVRLTDPYFYHLDTCFCPLLGLDYLIWPGAFDQESLSAIRSLSVNEIVVPEEEAKLFACNAVRIGRNVILPAGCEKTMRLLKENDYTPHPLEMSEFIKSGGACKCLTLAI
jgi:N-dimethylarginine dimethylaminohydrolase